MRRRLTWIVLGCLVAAGAILGRAAYFQLVGDERLAALGRRQFESKLLLRPRRGVLTDRNGEPLAVNVEVQSLAAHPKKLRAHKSVLRLLANALELPPRRLAERVSEKDGEKKEFTWIRRHLTDPELARLRKFGILGPNGDLPEGLWLVRETQRVYPHRDLAAHVLGDVNLDSEGIEGIELWAEGALRGSVASVSAVKDALGRPTFIDAVAAKDVHDGTPLALTIDASLQYAVEQELRASVLKTGARSGIVMVMDATTGELLALANEPSFDPNEPATADSARRRNRAITDGYEPGSTLKPVLLAAALQKGMKLGDRIWAEKGSFVVQGKRISEAEAHERFEWISLKKIIQLSSNVASAKLALRLGPEAFSSALRGFGFGSKTGIEFPGEISGRLPPKGDWKPLTLANVGFGQGVLVTPLQITRAYAAVANGGWLVQPRLVLPASTVRKMPPRRVIPQKTSELVTEALLAATEKEGTGTKAALEGYRIAGKTGTAQVVDPKTGRYSRTRFISTFVGFPIGLDRKMVVFTLLDEPKGYYYASDTAAPLFRSVFAAVANRFGIPPNGQRLANAGVAAVPLRDRSHQSTQDQMRWSVAKVLGAPEAELKWRGTSPDGRNQWLMPALGGLTAREAIRLLHDSGSRGLKLEVRGAGVVHEQSPVEGKIIADGGAVRLDLSEP